MAGQAAVQPNDGKKRLLAATVFAALQCAAAAVSAAAPFASFLCLLAAACGCYAWSFTREGRLLTLPGLFGLFWYGGEAVACLKLSRLSAPWVWQTWLSFALLWPAFLAGYEAFGRLARRRDGGRKADEEPDPEAPARADGGERRLRFVIAGLAGVSAAAFAFEAAYLGFVPALIRDTPHAYSYFHVSGVHYFTVSCALVPAYAVVWAMRYRKTATRGQKAAVALSFAESVAVPILIVSRFFLIMGAGLALLAYLEEKRFRDVKKSLRTAVLLVLALIPLYVLLTVFRAHSVEYLNGIFEMKNERMPIFITQPYMYIANNYENFNGLVTHLNGNFQYGLCQLYPVFALTGLKFVVPQILAGIGAVGLTKVELTTLTIAYDAYHDFGLAGVLLFGLLVGAFSAFLYRRRRRDADPAALMAYLLTAMYLILSFFTTWFSNPTTWFWYALTWMTYLFLRGGKRE